MAKRKELDTSAFGWSVPKKLNVLNVNQPVKKTSKFKDDFKWALMTVDMILRGVGVVALIFTALTWIAYAPK